MKLIYQVLASIALFLMLMNSIVTFATTREEAAAFHLKSASAQWRIEVLEDNFYFSKANEAELKTCLLGFFDRAGTPTYTRLNHYSVCLCIVFIFSVVGYFRERYLAKDRKRAEQGADGNVH